MPPEKLQWKELYQEVVTSGLCTGCAGCVIVCPHDVLGYNDDERRLQAVPDRGRFGAPTTAATARRAARRCTRACPRFRAWEPEIDEFLFGRTREPSEVGASTRTSCSPGRPIPVLAEVGQDGGLVSAILLYALEHDIIDAALVSYLEGDGSTWKAMPGVARTTRGHHRLGREPLHVLREPDGLRRSDRKRTPSASRSSA